MDWPIQGFCVQALAVSWRGTARRRAEMPVAILAHRNDILWGLQFWVFVSKANLSSGRAVTQARRGVSARHNYQGHDCPHYAAQRTQRNLKRGMPPARKASARYA